MKQDLLIALALITTTAAGCGQGDERGPLDGGTAVDSGDGHDAGGAEPMGPGIIGTLKNASGQTLESEMVLACMATTCLFGDTGVDGRFSFAIDPPASVALKTPEDLSVVPRRGAALCPIRIEDGSLVDVGTLYVPNLPEGVFIGPASMDPQTLMLGDGLELTLRRADLTPRVGDVLVDAAARLVPPAQVCPLLALEGEEILAVYALHPFAATSASPIAVSAASDLPAGTPVKFRTISEIDGHLSEPALGQADGSVVETEPGAGITELSWLVISR